MVLYTPEPGTIVVAVERLCEGFLECPSWGRSGTSLDKKRRPPKMGTSSTPPKARMPGPLFICPS